MVRINIGYKHSVTVILATRSLTAMKDPPVIALVIYAAAFVMVWPHSRSFPTHYRKPTFPWEMFDQTTGPSTDDKLSMIQYPTHFFMGIT